VTGFSCLENSRRTLRMSAVVSERKDSNRWRILAVQSFVSSIFSTRGATLECLAL
jgi:hypothetical protein